jgi:hypothetical protein
MPVPAVDGMRNGTDSNISPYFSQFEVIVLIFPVSEHSCANGYCV